MNKINSLSLDNYLSKRMGVDNQIGLLYKSVSFWGILVFAAVTAGAAIQDERFLSSNGNLVTWAIFMLSIAFAVAFYVLGRTRITRLLSEVGKLTESREQSSDALRAISHALTVLTCLILLCVLLAVVFIR